MRGIMRVKFLTITLLSQLVVSTPTATVWAAPTAVSKIVPVITEADKDFLAKKIGMEFDFPTNAKDKLVNDAANFMNDNFSAVVTYQDLFDKLVSQDINQSKTKTIPGAFLDASSDLYRYAADDISPEDFPDLTKEEVGARIASEKEDFKIFADILEKEARIVGSKQANVEECIAKLETQLAEARKKGKVIKKVYVYSDGPEYEAQYREAFPDITIVFKVFPEDINVFFTESEAIDDGYVYIDRIPIYYEPLYSPIWYPYYSRVYVDDGYFLGFGYPYDVGDYWGLYYGGLGLALWGGWSNWGGWHNWGHDRFGDRDWHGHHHRGEGHRGGDRHRGDGHRGGDRHRGDGRGHHRGDGHRDGADGDRRGRADGDRRDRADGDRRDRADGGPRAGHDGGRRGGADGDRRGGADGGHRAGHDGGRRGGADGGHRAGHDGDRRGGADGGHRAGHDGDRRGGADGGHRAGHDGGRRGGADGGHRAGHDGGRRSGADGGHRVGHDGGRRGGADGGHRAGHDGGRRSGADGGHRVGGGGGHHGGGGGHHGGGGHGGGQRSGGHGGGHR